MDFVQGFDRHQFKMISFDEYVSQDSWSRVVDLFVDILPLRELGFKDTPASEGRPPHPFIHLICSSYIYMATKIIYVLLENLPMLVKLIWR